jgi:HEXXH motif-containing protein
MTDDGAVLLGEIPDETRRLQSARSQRSIEDLIATCLATSDPALEGVYQRLRALESSRQLRVVTHPLFGALAGAALAEIGGGTALGRFAAPLNSLIADEELGLAGEWLAPDHRGLVALPFSGYVLQASPDVQEVHVAGDGESFRVTALGRTMTVGLSGGDFISIPISAHGWIDVWRLPRQPATVDPLTSVYRVGVEPGWSVEPPSRLMFQKWVRVLDESADLLGRVDPFVLEDVQLLARVIVPLTNTSRSRHLSSSSPALPDVVYMSWTDHVLQIVEAWVHEAGHQKLFLAEAVSPLVRSMEPLFESPWRPDLRPARGLLHGAFAFGGIARLWMLLANCRDCPPIFRTRARDSIGRVRGQVDDALLRIRGTGALTEAGEIIAERVARSMRDLPANTLTLGVVARESAVRVETPPGEDVAAIVRQYPWASTLSRDLRLTVDRMMAAMQWPDSLREGGRSATEAYIVRQCLPLAEAASSRPKSELLQLLELHLQCGMLWRCADNAADDTAETCERGLFEDAAVATLDGVSKSLASLDRKLDRRTRLLLMEFRRYAVVEAFGVLSPSDIWRRASPFLLVPSFIFSRRPAYQRPFRTYLTLLGLLDDLVDGWDDVVHRRRTWVTERLRDDQNGEAADLFLAECNGYIDSILSKLGADVPLWKQLVEQARSESRSIVSAQYGSERT